MYKEKELLTIKEWCTRCGIKIIKPNGFKGQKNKILNRKYTEKQFKKGLKTSYISINTEKGLAYLEAI